MKIIGLDLGVHSLGIAMSDKLGLIASPYKTLRYDDIDLLIKELMSIIESENVKKIVLGYPKNMNNTEGEAVKRTLFFKEKLESVCSLEIILIDERLSTVEAESYLLNEDMSRKKRKKIIDAVAASVILDTYLRSVNKNGR